jgi:uncharacterized protein YjdB
VRGKKWVRLFSLILAAVVIAAGIVPAIPAGTANAETPSFEATGTVYYVDDLGGNDGNAGMSPNEAWQTLDKVSATTFQPGDAILFKAGGIWTGGVHPKGSGTDGNPIRIDMYGEGPKPVINGSGIVAATIYFYSQEYWEVRNLEITNWAREPGQRRGIQVGGSSGGWSNPRVYKHFVFENLEIHSVKGTTGGIQTGGIVVWDESWNYIVSDVVINNNKIYSLDALGIYLNGGSFTHAKNNTISNNVIYDTSADGAILLNTTDGLIEGNVVYETHKRATGPHVPLWAFATRNAKIQYNEVFNTYPGGDAMAYDSDYSSKGTVIQYNYSHNNAGGAFLVTSNASSSTNYNTDSIVRYNISQNDLGAVFTVSGNPDNTHIYNNTVYIGESMSTRVTDFLNWNAWPSNTYFYNNILVNHGTGGYALGGAPASIYFDNNLFWGNHATAVLDKDANKIVADPMLAKPGTARIGRDTVVGYQLLQGSPAIGTGKIVANNGGKDFWNNPVPADSNPNIGAYEGPGLDPGSLPPMPEIVNFVANPGFESGDFTGYTNFYNGAAVVADNVRSGGHAAALSSANSGIEQRIEGLKPNTLYILSGFGKRVDSGIAALGVKEFGGAFKDILFNSGTNYAKKQIPFVTGNDNTSVVIYMYMSSGTGTVYFDDLSLFEYGKVDPEAVRPPLPPEPLPGLQNLAPLAQLSASSYVVNDTASFDPSKVVDGIKDNNYSRWLTAANAPYPHWLQMDWDQEYEINVVRVWSGFMNVPGSQIVDYEIQYWDSNAGSWKIAATVTNNNKDGNNNEYNHLVFNPVTTSKIRLYITKANATTSTARVLEVEVWEYDENAPNNPPVSVSSISVAGETLIQSIGGTSQMAAVITPTNAVNKSVIWSVVGLNGESTDVAEISATGLLTSLKQGKVKVIAAANDGSGVTGEKIVTIAIPDVTHTNIAPIARVSASSTNSTLTANKAVDGIKDDNYSRWLSEPGVPEPHWFLLEWDGEQVIDRVKVWSGLIGGTGSRIANFDIQYWDGSAWQTAESVIGNTKDGHLGEYNDLIFPAVKTNMVRMYITKGSPKDSMARLFEIEVYGKQTGEQGPPLPVTSISVTGANGVSAINGIGGTLQMEATVLPANATNKTVTWSIVGENGQPTDAASISTSGLVTALKSGTVKVVASANDGSGVSGERVITITDTPVKANLAPLAQVSASSERSDFPALKAVDGKKGDNNSRWLSGEGVLPPHWFLMDWGNRHYVIDNVKVWSGFAAGGSAFANYQIQYWDGTDWVMAASVSGNTQTTNSVEFPAVTTNKLRLYITKPTPSTDTTARLLEVEAWGYEYVNPPVPVNEITVSGEYGVSLITLPGGTLQMVAAVEPEDAAKKSVSWTIEPAVFDNVEAGVIATIDQTGLITAHRDGIVKAVAVANDGSGVKGEATVYIDTAPPVIGTPELLSYQQYEVVQIGFDAADMISGLQSLEVAFNGVATGNSLVIDAFSLTVGEYPIVVTAVDQAGNRSERAFTLIITGDIDNLDELIAAGSGQGWIQNTEIQASLMDHAANIQRDKDNDNKLRNSIKSMENFVNAQSGKHIDVRFAEILFGMLDLIKGTLEIGTVAK